MIWLLLLFLSFPIACLLGAVLRLSRELDELTVSVITAHKRLNDLGQAHADLLARGEAMSRRMEESSRVVWWLARMHGEVVESAQVADRARKAGLN